MIEFFNRLFKRETSGSTAKERLRLVLLSDHLSLAPDMVEALKRDLIEVISRYVEVDVAHCDVSFEQQDRAVAMLANIPIVAVPRNGRGPSGGGGERPPRPQELPADEQPENELHTTPATDAVAAPVALATASAEAVSISTEDGRAKAEQASLQQQTSSRKRRRRRQAAGPHSALGGALAQSPGQAS